MGIIHSFICSISFCVERVLTWVLCAFLIIFIMAAILVMLMYGISVGYHYAHKELALWSYQATKENLTVTTENLLRTEKTMERQENTSKPAASLKLEHRRNPDQVKIPLSNARVKSFLEQIKHAMGAGVRI